MHVLWKFQSNNCGPVFFATEFQGFSFSEALYLAGGFNPSEQYQSN